MTPPVLLAAGAVALVVLVVVALLLQRRRRARAVPPGPRTVAELVRLREVAGPPVAAPRPAVPAPVEDAPPVTAPPAAPAPRAPMDAAEAPAPAVEDEPVDEVAADPVEEPAAEPAPPAVPVPVAAASFHDAPWRRGAHLTGEHTLVALPPGPPPPDPDPPASARRRWSASVPRDRRGSAGPDRPVEARPVATTASGEGVEPGEPPTRRPRGGLSVVPDPVVPRPGWAPGSSAERSRRSAVARIGAIGAVAAVAGAVARHRADDSAPRPAAPAQAAQATPAAEPVAPTPAAERAEATPATEQVAATPAAAPVAEPPVTGPVAGTPAAEPSAAVPAAPAATTSPAAERVAPAAVPTAADGGPGASLLDAAEDGPRGADADQDERAAESDTSPVEPVGTGSPDAGPITSGPISAGPISAEPVEDAPVGPLDGASTEPAEETPAATTGSAAPASCEPAAAEVADPEPEDTGAGVDAAVMPQVDPLAGGPTVTGESAPEPDRRDPTRVAAEQAAADLALLRTFGASDLASRPGRAPDVALVRAVRPDPEPPAGDAQPVRFRVVRRGGKPVAGVAVALLDDRGRETAAGRADAAGAGELTAPRPGSFVLVATAAEHQPGAVAVTVAGGPVAAELLLVHSAALVGTVSGEDGAIGGARVTLVQDGEVVDAAQSDADGRFRIADLSAGEYAVSVAAAGCEPDLALVAVPDETEAVHDVELAPAGVAAH